ncbi:MAG: hypothetical protein JWP58_1404 [Hymenobacter sp.]|nr:hypothetical protein [Hymenobacter sp.]
MEIGWWHFICQPNAVVSLIEWMPGPVHRTSSYSKHNQSAMAPSHDAGRGNIGAQVYVVARHLPQSVAQDIGLMLNGRAVV